MLCYWEAKRIVYWLHLIDYIIFMKTYVPLKYVVLDKKETSANIDEGLET